MSSQGWSCATLGDGFKAVLTEEEAALLAQEQQILKEIEEGSLHQANLNVSVLGLMVI